jgi:hypothetical protein
MQEENANDPELEDVPEVEDAEGENIQQDIGIPDADGEAASQDPPAADEATAVDTQQEGNDAVNNKPVEAPNWLPPSLSLGFMISLLSWDLSIIIVLLALTTVSLTKNGILTI